MNYYSPSSKQKGFTLIELTVVMVFGLMIAASSLALFNQQLSIYKVLKQQDFLLRDAPKIIGILNKIVPRANAFQMFADVDDLADSSGVITGASVLALRFQDTTKNLSGDAQLEHTFAVIAFDSDTGDLNYYNNLPNLNAITPDSPSWKIATNVKNATFFIQNGVIRMTFIGPNGEDITYSSTTLH